MSIVKRAAFAALGVLAALAMLAIPKPAAAQQAG